MKTNEPSNRRAVLGCVAASFALALCAPLTAAAQDAWPARPVRIVVPFAAGGTTDVVARALAKDLSEMWGQPVVVENRGGAGGNIAAELVARAEPDGHTLLVATQGIIAINKALYATLPYDPDADFTPLAMLGRQANVLVVHPGALDARSVADIIEAAKAKPGEVSYGGFGVGSFSHLSMELLASRAGIRLLHVPYRGSGPMRTDLAAGRVAMALDAIATSKPLVEAGTLRAVAVSSPGRSSALPDVPPVADTIPGYDASAWYGVFAHARTPAAALAALDAGLRAALASAPYQELLAKQGVEAMPEDREALKALVARDNATWREAVRQSGAKVE